MKRPVVLIDPDLHRKAKAQAALEGVSLKEWVATLVERRIKASKRENLRSQLDLAIKTEKAAIAD